MANYLLLEEHLMVESPLVVEHLVVEYLLVELLLVVERLVVEHLLLGEHPMVEHLLVVEHLVVELLLVEEDHRYPGLQHLHQILKSHLCPVLPTLLPVGDPDQVHKCIRLFAPQPFHHQLVKLNLLFDNLLLIPIHRILNPVLHLLQNQ